MTPSKSAAPPAAKFEVGEKVYVARGVYQGTLGLFLRTRPDARWAEVHETLRNEVRTHPVEYLRACPPGELDWKTLLA